MAHAPAPVRNSPFLDGDVFLVVSLDDFEGPLDLLLHLIRQQDIDVFDIPIHTITEQFLRAIEGIRAAQLDHAGEFLEMAASLVRIKAQMLLPRREDAEDEDPRAELVRRLLEYEQIQEISKRLSVREAERARIFGKGFVEARPRPSLVDTPLETTWEDVFEAAVDVRMPAPHDLPHRIVGRPVAMEDKVAVILETLEDEARVLFSRLLRGFDGAQAKMHGVMTFLASLELSRRRDVLLRQAQLFGDLWIYAGEDPPGDVERVRGDEGTHGAEDEMESRARDGRGDEGAGGAPKGVDDS